MTERHGVDLPRSKEYDEFLDENHKLHLAHLEVQRMIDSALLRYEENTLRRLTDGVIKSTMKTLLKTAAKQAKKGILGHIYEAVEDNVKQALNSAAADKTISSRIHSLTKSQKFSQIIVVYLMENPKLTAPIIKPDKRYAEIAAINEAYLYDASIIVGKENEEEISPLPLTEGSQDSSSTPKQDQKKISEMKKEVSHSSGSSSEKCVSSRCSPEDYKVDRHNKGSKDVNVLCLVHNHFTEALNFYSYCLDKPSQKYYGRMSGKIAK